MIQINTILHCTDFSETARQAWYVAQMLARDHRAKLVIIHVSNSHDSTTGAARVPVYPPELAENRLRAMVKDSSKVSAEAHIETGAAGPTIVAAANKYNADLIVMGTHGETGLDQMIIGSVAEYVVRNAHCAVMTLKPGSGWALSQESEPATAMNSLIL